MTEAEFREAFQRNKDVLFRFAYRMTGSEATAEDIVQDCFTALWRKPEAYEPGRGTLRAFLLGMARNRVLKQWRDDRPQDELGRRFCHLRRNRFGESGARGDGLRGGRETPASATRDGGAGRIRGDVSGANRGCY